MPATYTHVAQKIHTGYRHVSNALVGHTDRKPGKRHAANVDGVGYSAVCGEYVAAEQINEWGEYAAAPVSLAADGRVTCRRCLARRPTPVVSVPATRQLWAVIGIDAAGVEAVYCYTLTESGAEHAAGAIVRPRGDYPADYAIARLELRTVPANTSFAG